MKLNEIRTTPEQEGMVMRRQWHTNVVRKITTASEELEGLIQYLKDANLAEEGQLQPYEQALKNLDVALSSLTLRV